MSPLKTFRSQYSEIALLNVTIERFLEYLLLISIRKLTEFAIHFMYD